MLKLLAKKLFLVR